MAGYQVDVADDGEAGLIVAAARTPTAAIIDLGVPIIDGWLLAESLRYVFGERIRLIALTSRDEPEEHRAAHAAATTRATLVAIDLAPFGSDAHASVRP